MSSWGSPPYSLFQKQKDCERNTDQKLATYTMLQPNVKNVVIVDGQFSNNGNFSGYDSLGTERYHIPARMMTRLGYAKGANEKIEFPLFATVVLKSFAARLDANGQPIPNADGTFGIKDRPTVTSLFTTLEAGVDANVANKSYDLAIKAAVKKAESSFGFEESTLSAITSVAG